MQKSKKEYIILGASVTAIVLSFVLVATAGLVMLNLKDNAVYYARYTPHAPGVEPELMMLAENPEEVYALTDITTIRFLRGPKPSVTFYSPEGKQIGYFCAEGSSDSKNYRFDTDRLEMSFVFDSKFQLISAFDMSDGVERVEVGTLNEEEITEELYDLVNPLLERQKLRGTNLQWLFDIVYHDKFN